LRTQPKHFWKYISIFKRNDQSVTQIEVGDNIIMEPQFIAEAFADHFASIFSPSSSVNIMNNSLFTHSDFFNILFISDSDVKQAISHLGSMKCVRPDDDPNFIIKGYSEIFTPLLSHIFSLSLLTGKFLSLWKQVAVVPIFKKGNKALVVNYRPISILNSQKFFKLLCTIPFLFILNLSYTQISTVLLNQNL
jgi:hypothetical protein